MENPGAGRVASPGRRLGAYILDVIAWWAFYVVALSSAVFSEILAAVLVLGIPVFLLFTWAKSTSPGKWLLGMYAARSDGRPLGFWLMAFREIIGKLISGLPFALGFLWILFDKERQGWHDKMATSYVMVRPAAGAAQSPAPGAQMD